MSLAEQNLTFIRSVVLFPLWIVSQQVCHGWATSIHFLSRCSYAQNRFGCLGGIIPTQMTLQDSAMAGQDTGAEDGKVDDFDVSLEQLQDFCQMQGLESTGNKAALVQRLRDYAAEQAQRSDDGIFYFSSPSPSTTKGDNKPVTSANKTQSAEDRSNFSNENSKTAPDTFGISSTSYGSLPTRINEKGQTVVTTYNSADPNDLTGFGAHSRPGDSLNGVATTLGTEGGTGVGNSQQVTSSGALTGGYSKSKQERSEEYEEARELCCSLVAQLLATTGVAGFGDEFNEGIKPLTLENDVDLDDDSNPPSSATSTPKEYVGFDPSQVPAKWLTHCSSALRHSGGKVLSEVVREFEIQAIGNDGMISRNVDDPSKGGGHYREVQKVYAFLEGFRQAEVRRIARNTASMLINTIVNEGQRGLDVLLSHMARGGPDSTGEEGQLNDSLIEYLNDLVRNQEQKLDQQQNQNSGFHESDRPHYHASQEGAKKYDEMNAVVEETIDLADPQLHAEAEEELKSQNDENYQLNGLNQDMPASRQLLILLQLLRDRVKVEAAYQNNQEQSNVQHLKTLAACLKAMAGRVEVDQILNRHLGGSLDRMDEFGDLLRGSIEYAESTTNDLAPSKGKYKIFDLGKLREIQIVFRDFERQQKARLGNMS